MDNIKLESLPAFEKFIAILISLLVGYVFLEDNWLFGSIIVIISLFSLIWFFKISELKLRLKENKKQWRHWRKTHLFELITVNYLLGLILVSFFIALLTNFSIFSTFNDFQTKSMKYPYLILEIGILPYVIFVVVNFGIKVTNRTQRALAKRDLL